MWTVWQARAMTLAQEIPESRTDMEFYSRLLGFQADVHQRAEMLLQGEPQPLDTGTVMAALAFFARYWREYLPLWEGRLNLEPFLKPTFDDLLELLAVFSLDDRIPRCVLVHGGNADAWRMLAKALMQPAAAVMYHVPTLRTSAGGRCPRCKHWPCAGSVAEGERWLHCSLCLFEWRWTGAGCVKCGAATQPIRLDRFSWMAAEGCRGCGSYLKYGDKSARPECISFVDDLATRALDDAAAGYTRVEPRLF